MSAVRMPAYVAVAEANRWVVKNPAGLRNALWRLGFRGGFFLGSMWWRGRDKSFPEMALLAMRLRDLGIAFSYGRDWAPSEVVGHLRDQGLYTGPYLKIAWRDPGDWSVEEC